MMFTVITAICFEKIITDAAIFKNVKEITFKIPIILERFLKLMCILLIGNDINLKRSRKAKDLQHHRKINSCLILGNH